jgi:hypothetical protein
VVKKRADLLKSQQAQRRAYRPKQNKISLFQQEQSHKKKMDLALSASGEKPQLFKMKKFENVAGKVVTQNKRPATAQPASKGVPKPPQKNILSEDLLRDLRNEEPAEKKAKRSANQRYGSNEDDLSEIGVKSNVNMNENDLPDIGFD